MSEKIMLRVSGIVPAFKNKKRAILDRNTGRMRTLTDAKTQKRMEQIIQGFVCQLNSGLAITEEETLTGRSRQSSIALLKRLRGLDDSRQWMPEIHVYSGETDKGNERAEITIEAL